MRVRDGLFQQFARNLAVQQGRMAHSMRNLGSGTWLHSSADDAAGLGRSESMRARIWGTRRALRNLSAGRELLNTADAALQEIRSMLQRARELAVQSANGTLTDADRDHLQAEIIKIREGIDYVAQTAFYNQQPIFGVDYGSTWSPLVSDNFNTTAWTDMGVTTAQLQNGNVGLPFTNRNLFADSFISTAAMDTARTTAAIDTAGGRAVLPWLLAAVASDAFNSTGKVNAALTSAVVDTAMGLVELGKVMSPTLTNTFSSTAGTNVGLTTAQVDPLGGLVRQPVVQQALWSDTFADMSGIDPALTNAVIDTAMGMALLTANWGGGLSDSFGNTIKTDTATTTALVDTLGGLVRVGQTFKLWTADSFADASQVGAGTTAVVDMAGGWATLPSSTVGLWTDSPEFGLPQALTPAKSDTFTNTSQANTALTTAMVRTAMGLVQLGQVYNTLLTDTFANSSNIASNSANLDTANQWVTLSQLSQALWSDSFDNLGRINGAWTSANIDTASGKAVLTQLWAAGVTDTFANSSKTAGGTSVWNAAAQLIEMSRVLNERYSESVGFTAPVVTTTLQSDTFTGTTGTNGAQTSASVSTTDGWVQLTGSAATTVALGADSFDDLSGIGAGTTVAVDPVTGTTTLGTETWTVAADSFENLSQVDTASTDAVLASGQVELPYTYTTETIAAESFDSTAGIDDAQTTATISGGNVSLTSSWETVGQDTFSDGSLIDWSQSSGIHVTSTGELALGPSALLNEKYDPSATAGVQAVYAPGSNPAGWWDSGGVHSTSVVQLADGTLQMFYVASKQANAINGVGMATSSDGGQTWTTGVDVGLLNVTTSTQIDVHHDGSSYTMFLSRADGIYTATSADGSTWSAETKLSIAGAPAQTGFGRATVVQADNGTYHMMYQTSTGIHHATASSPTGSWTLQQSWSSLGGEPELVKESLAPGVSQYALYTRDSSGSIVRRTTTDFATWSTAQNVVTAQAGFAPAEVHVGGAVYDANTGVTRMLYYGKGTGGGAESGVGLAYTTGRTAGTMVSDVLNTTDTVQTLRLNATANTAGGTVSYQVSNDGGTTWTTITDGETITLVPNQGLKLRIDMTNTSGDRLSGGPSVDGFTLESQVYATPQQVVSQVYNFAAPTDNITLDVNQTTPDGTAISYTYSTDGITWNTITAGQRVDLASPASSFYLKAELMSSPDRLQTPVLHDWTLTTETASYQGPRSVTTQNYTFGDSIDQFELNAAQSANGGSIQWQYSTDGGTTWLSASLGTNTLSGTAQQLKLRATMDASPDGLNTPVIQDYSVTATRHTAPQMLYTQNYTFGEAVSKLTLSTTQATPGGSGIAYEVSTDGGATWQSVTPGSEVTLAAATTQVQMRAAFNTSDGYYAPVLSDYTITGTTVGYPTSNVWTSTVTNMSYGVQNVTLNVNQDTPAGTGITYEITTDGGSTWQAITPGSNVAVTPGSQLALRASLTSGDPTLTPRLLDYSLTTNVYQNHSQWVSGVIAAPYNATAVKLTALESKPAGTDILYEVSADGGSTWQAVTNGDIVQLASPGDQLQMRATLTSTDPNVAATLQDIKLETYDYATTDTFQSTYTSLDSATTQVQLQANATLYMGTDILYEVTNDGGATWMTVNPGDTATFATAGDQIGMRATLLGTGAATPQLLDYTLNVPGYVSEQWVYSTVQAHAEPVTNVTLNANAITPGGTGIAYEVSTDGGATWTAVTNGGNTVVPSGTDLVFRAKLSSTSPGLTPELLDYTLSTNVSSSGAQMVTSTIDTGAPVRYLKLNVTEQKPAGTDILYELSNDGGTTWVTATPGMDVDMGSYGSQVLMRTTFLSSDPQNLAAPRLEDYSIEALEYADSQFFQSDFTAIGTPTTQVKLNANHNLAASTGITYQVTNDGGSTWVTVNPGDTATFATAGSQIGMRAVLTSDGQFTPELLDYSLEVPGYETGHYFYSGVQSFAEPVNNVTFNASATTPAGTAISYEVSTDGGSTWQAITSGANQAVTAGTDLLFRALLETSDPNVTPVLHDYSFSTNVNQSGKQLVTTVTNTTEPTRYLRLGVTEDMPAGTGIAYELSNDGGSTWVTATPGSVVDMGSYGTELMMRATFSSTNGQAPKLLDYQIESHSYVNEQVFQSQVQSLSADTNQVRLTVDANTPGGTGITYFASVDGGTTWEQISAGENTLATAGSQLVFKAVMTTDGTATPELLDYALEVPGYESPRYVYSQVHSFGEAVTNVNLAVTENKPAGTGITYEISTDGGSTWQAITPGQNTLLASPGADLQMRARLSTSDAGATPELLDYALTTNQNTSGSVWYSTVQTTAEPVTALQLNVNQSKPTGTDILYEVSADGGSSWQAITPGQLTNISNPGAELVMRATFTSNDPASLKSAQLYDFELLAQSYASSQSMTSNVTQLGQVTNEVRLDVNANTPAGTGIAYEVSLDGGTTWETVAPGAAVTLGHSGDQMVMRATLTGNGAVTPQLLDYQLSVPSYESNHWVYSTTQTFASPITNLTLTANDIRPDGTNVRYQISTDGGTTWRSAAVGQEIAQASPTSQVTIRALMESDSAFKTPEILDWGLTTRDFDTVAEWQSQAWSLTDPVESVWFNASQTASAGTEIAYEISNDGGVTWYTANRGEEVSFGAPGQDLVVRAVLTGPGGLTPNIHSYTLSAEAFRPDVENRGLIIQAGPEFNQKLVLDISAIQARALGFDQVSVGTQEEARLAMGLIDAGISQVSTVSAQIGAASNRVSHAMSALAAAELNLTDGLSRLTDTDMAAESMRLVKASLQTDVAMNAMSQGLNVRREQLIMLLTMPTQRK